jgi:DNA-binding NarL/FixJ family response regulator
MMITQTDSALAKLPKPRMVIADDHSLFAGALGRLLASAYDIVGTLDDGRTMLDAVTRLHPDIVLLDLNMPPFTGVEMVTDLLRLDPQIRIVIVTMCEDPILAAELLRLGASAYVLKNCGVEELLHAVRAAYQQKKYVVPELAGAVIKSMSAGPSVDAPALTERQRDVLRLLARGLSMKEAASELDLTPRTVAFHKYRMMHVLKIKSSAELVRYAVMNHFV